MQSRLHTLSHHPQESNSFTSPKAQGNVAGELDNCQHSGAGIWTAFLPKGLALSCLAGQLLLYAMRKGGMVTDLCTIGQRKFWVTLGKELSFSDFLLPTPQGNGDNSWTWEIHLRYPDLKIQSLTLLIRAHIIILPSLLKSRVLVLHSSSDSSNNWNVLSCQFSSLCRKMKNCEFSPVCNQS